MAAQELFKSREELIGPKNTWRSTTPGVEGWSRTARPDDPNKFFVVSVDNHVNEPIDYMKGRIEARFVDRVPRVVRDDEGNEWMHVEGQLPLLVKPAKTKTDHLQKLEQYENWEVLMPWTAKMEKLEEVRSASARTVEDRLADDRLDGVDAEIMFPQKGLMGYATQDADFAMAMCHAWNEWALEYFGAQFGRLNPVANVPTGDVKLAMKEVEWAAKNGFRALCLPNKPIYGPTLPEHLAYHHEDFEPLWSLIAEVDLPITFHVSTAEDPRLARGRGGAIINYITHAMVTPMDPIVKLIASGVFERHKTVRATTVENGIGYLPWLLENMDHVYKAHHMWVRPVIPELPSHYYRNNCAATFLEEPHGLKSVIEFGLEDNIMWSSDYPHHEGSFPFSSESIERQMAGLTEVQREKALGLNAARFFKLDIAEIRKEWGADSVDSRR